MPDGTWQQGWAEVGIKAAAVVGEQTGRAGRPEVGKAWGRREGDGSETLFQKYWALLLQILQ